MKRLSRSKGLLSRFATQGLDRVLFSDEKLFTVEQDNAPAHIAKSTQEWLGANIPHFITKVEWSPSSPDLNPLVDFGVKNQLEISCEYQIIEDIFEARMGNIPQEIVHTAVAAVNQRLKSVIKQKGGYIE
ncbi:hypothetical protein LOD99_10614 [Oopsacas minuta]|uniref:Tc1-like transposase DDE domain-containing protein n=1 Tax=Oopsacas minuta TaxID=111878 RepID=A0AAV7KIQ1_9METZ|nr:hypothetical protein LOD99_10614 [Oopsacas minuta]